MRPGSIFAFGCWYATLGIVWNLCVFVRVMVKLKEETQILVCMAIGSFVTTSVFAAYVWRATTEMCLHGVDYPDPRCEIVADSLYDRVLTVAVLTFFWFPLTLVCAFFGAKFAHDCVG